MDSFVANISFEMNVIQGNQSFVSHPKTEGTFLAESSILQQNGNNIFLANNTHDVNESRQMADFRIRPMYELEILRYVVVALYLTTFVFGIIGNTLTIVVLLFYRKVKTVASCFILNLAVADDLFMLSLPFLAHNTYKRDWIFGSFMCKLMNAFNGINLYASIFTMVLMSMDRLFAVVWPLRSIRFRTISKAMFVCLAIWMCCITIMMPMWLYAHAQEVPDGTARCTVFWPRDSATEHQWFWTNFELLIGFVLPIVIMVVCYSLLLQHIVRGRPVTREQTKTPVKRVTIMVFTVTLVFIVCWTPYHIIRYINAIKTKYYRDRREKPEPQDIVEHAIFNTVGQALVFLSSCCNPIIYGISSSNWRRMYADVICYLCGKVKVGTGNGETAAESHMMLSKRNRMTRNKSQTTIIFTDDGVSFPARRSPVFDSPPRDKIISTV